MKLADAEATGTINNHDPMPLAWMVRFGRTVGSHVVDALSTRLEGTSGSHVTVAGINVIGAKGDEPVLTDDDPFGLPEWAKNAEREADGEALTADDILLRSAFHLSSGGDGTHAGPAFTAWGRVATGGFEAEADNVTMDGDVTTGLIGFIGFDAEWERALAGIMFSQSKGEGSYRLDPVRREDRALFTLDPRSYSRRIRAVCDLPIKTLRFGALAAIIRRGVTDRASLRALLGVSLSTIEDVEGLMEWDLHWTVDPEVVANRNRIIRGEA